MDIQFKIDPTAEEEEELARVLGCAHDSLPKRLSQLGESAIQEYMDMILARKAFKQASDFREYRLFLLISSAFNKTIPDEQDVTNLFQTTPTESRALIRSVLSKYQYQLKEIIDQTLLEILMRAKQISDNGIYYVVINSQNLVDVMNQILAEIDGTLTPVTKSRGKVSTYEIWPKSREELLNYLNGRGNGSDSK